MLVNAVETITLGANEKIVEQWSRQNGMYVLLKGSIKLIQKLNSGDTAQVVIKKSIYTTKFIYITN